MVFLGYKHMEDRNTVPFSFLVMIGNVMLPKQRTMPLHSQKGHAKEISCLQKMCSGFSGQLTPWKAHMPFNLIVWFKVSKAKKGERL